MTLIKSIFFILGFSLLLYGLHIGLNNYIFNFSEYNEFVKKTHLFLFIVTFTIISSLLFLHKKNPTYTGFAYLGSVLLKMALSVFFLYPYIVKKADDIKIVIIQFFLLFFIYLLFEVLLLLNIIKNKGND